MANVIECIVEKLAGATYNSNIDTVTAHENINICFPNIRSQKFDQLKDAVLNSFDALASK